MPIYGLLIDTTEKKIGLLFIFYYIYQILIYFNADIYVLVSQKRQAEKKTLTFQNSNLWPWDWQRFALSTELMRRCKYFKGTHYYNYVIVASDLSKLDLMVFRLYANLV